MKNISADTANLTKLTLYKTTQVRVVVCRDKTGKSVRGDTKRVVNDHTAACFAAAVWSYHEFGHHTLTSCVTSTRHEHDWGFICEARGLI